MGRLPRDVARFDQAFPQLDQFVERVDLPGKVIQPDLAAGRPRCALTQAEEPEIVVVRRIGYPKEGTVHPGLAAQHHEPQHGGVENHRSLYV